MIPLSSNLAIIGLSPIEPYATQTSKDFFLKESYPATMLLTHNGKDIHLLKQDNLNLSETTDVSANIDHRSVIGNIDLI
jgi:hypothetical protein